MPLRTPVRCAIYTRHSVDQNDDLSSCQIQFDLCRAFVQSQKGQGWVLVDCPFDDDGYSGTTLERPAIQGLLKLIRCGAVDRVVIHRLDRLSLSLRDFVFLAQEFRANNVELHVVAAPGGREPCRGGLVNAGEIETAVLSAVGLASTGLSSKEGPATLKEAIRRVVFSADTGRIKIEFQPDSSPAEDLDGQVSGRVEGGVLV